MAGEGQDLVELTRRSMYETNDRDFDAALAVFSEDAVFDMSEAGLARFEGRAAVRSYLEEWISSYERQRFSSWEGEELGGGVVFVDALLEALPAGSTASVRERWAFTVRWDRGAIAEVAASQDIERARADARRLARRSSSGDVSQNVEVVRTSLRHWRRAGEPRWDLAVEDLEIHDHDILDAGEYHGREGFWKWMADWSSAWSDFGMHVEDLLDAGEDRVVVLLRMRATGRGSSVSVEREDAIVYQLRDGLIARIDYFNDRERAFAAAGLAH